MKFVYVYPVELVSRKRFDYSNLPESARGWCGSRVKKGIFYGSWGGPHENLKFFRNFFFRPKSLKMMFMVLEKYLELTLGINLEQPKGTN